MKVSALRLAMSACFRIIAASIAATTDWAFSAFFGTGWYEIHDNRSVFILPLPPEQQLRRSSFTPAVAGAPARRQLGIELHYPLSLGLNDVSEIDGLIHPGNFGTFSFTPGIELEIPVTARWYLRPMLHAGWGKETSSGSSATPWLGPPPAATA